MAIAAAVLVLLPACGADKSPPAVGEFADAHAGLCKALADASASRPTSARSAFLNTAHAPLHVLAARVEPKDRPAASRLLIAKQSVEAVAWDDRPAAVAQLSALSRATRDAIAALDQPVPRPCKEEA